MNTVLINFSILFIFYNFKRFFNKKSENLSQNISHFGFSLLILSILFNNIFSTEVITNLKIGETYESKKLNINFERLSKKINKILKQLKESSM